MPGPPPDPPTIDVGGTVVTIVTHVRDGNGTAGHNRTPSYFAVTDAGIVGVVWHLDRGEERHNAQHNQYVHDYAELVWFCRDTDGLEHGPYPGFIEAVTALLEGN